jgi:L-ascorbate metabolism protein UlaG (beta-lactamase superfamily)
MKFTKTALAGAALGMGAWLTMTRKGLLAPATPPVLELPGHAASHNDTGSITFIGTATVLLQVCGFTLLTDPNFLHRGQHIHIGYGLTTKRLTDPAMDIEDLPPLDACVLSHMHEDHFDRVAIEKLDHSLPIATTPNAAQSLRFHGFSRPLALSTWQSLVLRKDGVSLRLTSMPGRHGPYPLELAMPPVMGTMLDFERGGERLLRLYISGDTLLHEALHEIPRRFPGVDLMLLHLGGTRLGGVLVTMDAAQGLKTMQLIRPRKTLPIHYNDYPVFKDPLDNFKHAVSQAGLEGDVVYLRHGDTFDFDLAELRGQPRSAVGAGAGRGAAL